MSRKKLVIPDPNDGEGGDGAGEGGDGGADTQETERIGWEYAFELRAMVRELEEDDRIAEVDAEIGSPVANFTVETMEHGLGQTIPRFVKRLYHVADGVRIEWTLEDGDEVRPGGGIHLYDFATVFDSWLHELWSGDPELDEETSEFLWSLRGFDGAPEPEGDRWTVVCVEENDYPTFDLFIHDRTTHQSHLLSVDFETYLEMLLETRGTYGWVHALADFEGAPPAYVQRWRRHFRETMHEVFPEVDLDPFIQE